MAVDSELVEKAIDDALGAEDSAAMRRAGYNIKVRHREACDRAFIAGMSGDSVDVLREAAKELF